MYKEEYYGQAKANAARAAEIAGRELYSALNRQPQTPQIRKDLRKQKRSRNPLIEAQQLGA